MGLGFSLFSQALLSQNNRQAVYLNVLGTVQDGGAPHLGCIKSCCSDLSESEQMDRKVTALAVTQPDINFTVLFEATPDMVHQWSLLPTAPKAIFLTHAHMGHYTGLIHLGREALAARGLPVYVLPKMKSFLVNNGPWSQLVQLKNILLYDLDHGQAVDGLGAIQVTPILVPHRDEFSETAGYKIEGPDKSALFIPDIDKWSKWEWDLEQMISEVDFAFIDATFFDAAEINYRPIEEIPHPLVKETIDQLKESPPTLRSKIYFIHMNHTNPMLDPKSDASKWVLEQGFHIARIGQKFKL